MMTIDVYAGAFNAVKFKNLKYQNPPIDVPEHTLTRAIFHFGDYCLDTDVPEHPIEFYANNTCVKMKPGLVSGLKPSRRKVPGFFTLYDHFGKYAWGQYEVAIHEWRACNQNNE